MTDLSGKIATQQVAQRKNPTIKDLVQAQQAAIEVQLAGALNSAAFVRAAISTIASSPKLQQATPASVLGGIMLAAQLKLEIGPALGHFYLTPRREKGVDICLPIIGYQGYIELAYRSGRIEKIETFLVRDGDKFDHGANSERGRFFEWNPADYDEDRAWTGVVAMAKIKGAGTVWAYLPKDKVLARRPHYWDKGTPWQTNEEEMARKTGIRALAPYLPKSTELAKAIEADENKVESIAGIHDLVVTRDEPEVMTVQERPADPMERTAEEQAEDAAGQ
ncbi:recombinase RecT [Cryobacterium sp. GrIS_2_6]|uniref:recombinase RecT n=1 Tax=Cryobacterium sp. GrIS_2_6 TaxID=3162785 RepID=UPI002DFFE3BA|nr:recombinase RecT [Cryobacterium psychrotolerans]MEC5149187.1 recombination protein RecT [Cryobacterium psychrotolerans]MEC5149268.1 recombination protein RecT [Cryobacterium psychrotolerans]MEC5149347.1 recombination protein RecT [Cryobacterium psychrotolerans]